MLYRQYEYQAYIRALKRGRQRGNKKTSWLLLLLATLTAVYFGLHLRPVSSCISYDPPGSEINLPDTPNRNPQTNIEASGQPEPIPPPCQQARTVHPGARDPWAQDFGASMETQTVRVAAGDTLALILRRSGIEHREAYKVVQALKTVFEPARLREGHELKLDFISSGACPPVFQGLRLELGPREEIQLVKGVAGGFFARRASRELATRHQHVTATVQASLYQAAHQTDMPMDVLMQILRAYSYDVDFQRDIQPGDRIEVLYEEKVDGDGEFVKAGEVLYATLHTCGRKLQVYRFKTADDCISRLFDSQGRSVQKALMLTPVDGARLSSGYGMRKHPILGYNKMHRGLDFAAPMGTPIMAAGDGIVEYAGPRGTYGHYIRIRHPNMYQTVYAHLSRYADNIKKGVRVKQGEAIGYIGSTGRSTGPHLHFEVRHGGTAVNPATVRTPPGRELSGKELERFLLAKTRLETLYASLSKDDKKLAQAENNLSDTGIAHQ